jgi:uncharacterized membrane protein YvbJ
MAFVRPLVAILFVFTFFVSSANAGYSDPNQFWKSFRQAVLDNDMDKIIALTYFPFKVRGPTDSDPIMQYNKNKFPIIYKKLITQEEEIMTSGASFVSSNMFELIRKKRTLDPKDFNSPDCLRIYSFKFKVIKGCWYFTWAYTGD